MVKYPVILKAWHVSIVGVKRGRIRTILAESVNVSNKRGRRWRSRNRRNWDFTKKRRAQEIKGGKANNPNNGELLVMPLQVYRNIWNDSRINSALKPLSTFTQPIRHLHLRELHTTNCAREKSKQKTFSQPTLLK